MKTLIQKCLSKIDNTTVKNEPSNAGGAKEIGKSARYTRIMQLDTKTPTPKLSILLDGGGFVTKLTFSVYYE